MITAPIPVRPRHRVPLLCLLAAIAFGSAGIAARAAEPVKRHYDLPADTVEKSLKRLSEQSGLEVLFPTNFARGLRTTGVQGDLTAREALNQMLNGTGLVGAQDEKTGALTVKRASETTPSGAAQTAPGNRRDARTRDGADRVVSVTMADQASRGASGTDGAIELSPFEVRAETDGGYYGSNTLSGTRLNTNLQDLAASITVVTKQQMTDLGLADLNDIFMYEANTEGSGNFTDVFYDQSGVPQDGVDSITNAPGGNRVRGLGRANIARDGFATNEWANMPLDTYNVDAVEISRGPNSNIFGVGEGSGTVNMVTSQARLDRSMSRASARVDSYGGWRTTLDLNRPLGRMFGLRVLGLYEEKGYVRKPSADDTSRITLAGTFKPFQRTTFKASYESFHNFARRPNIVTPVDFISEWIDAGRPTWDPTTFTAKRDGVPIGTFPASQDNRLPVGLMQPVNYNPVRFVDGYETPLWTVARLGNSANPNVINSDVRFLESGTEYRKTRATAFPLFHYKGFNDQSLYDWESVNAIAANYIRSRTDVYRLDLEQFIIDNPTHVLAAKLGFFREDADKYNHLYFGGGQSGMSSFVMVDVNEKLLDGSANPFFLRPFIRGSAPVSRLYSQKSDTSRAQLAYQLDLTRQKNFLSWFGRHRVSGYGEFQESEREQRDMAERVLSDHSWVNVANRSSGTIAGGGGVSNRYYLGDNVGQNIEYGPSALYNLPRDSHFYWRNNATGAWTSEPARWGETPTGGTAIRKELRTMGVTLQNYLLGERIITTVGWRYDRLRNMTASVWTRLNPEWNGERRYMPEWNGPWVAASGRTKTTGIVVRPLRGVDALERRAREGGVAGFFAEAAATLNLHYNESDSFIPADLQRNILDQVLPNPSSTGKDYGFSFSLFDGKLYLKANKYETLVLGNRNNAARTLANSVRRIDLSTDANTPFTTFRQWAEQVANQRFINQGNPTPSPEQLQAEMIKIMKLDPQYFGEDDDPFAVGPGLTGEVDNAASRGLEFELNYNPTRYWTLKLNLTKQEAVNTSLAPTIQQFLALRQPIWEAAVDDQGVSFWQTSGAREELALRESELKLMIALQGLPRPQVRKWRFNAATSFNLAALGSDRKWLRELTVGGSVRWEDKASVGFYGMAPEADGVIRTLDPTRPIWDKSRMYADAWARYNMWWFGDRIRASVQLNVRNMFEGGRLQAIGVDPDGSPYAFRIIDPRQFLLTMNFEL